MSLVNCPICNSEMALDQVNAHLDRCAKASPAPPASPKHKKTAADDTNNAFAKLQAGSAASSKAGTHKPQNTSKVSPAKRRAVVVSTPAPPAPPPKKRKSEDPASSSSSASPPPGVSLGDKPLAELVRPKSLDDFVGQAELVGRGALLRRLVDRDAVPSLILWGPSGVGKTTLARLLSGRARFVELSATAHGAGDVRRVVEEARNERRLTRRRTVLFLDEVHRFNRAQQDVLLPHVERGEITLVGATTENPSFKVNSALLSRCRVFVMHKLEQKDVEKMLRRAVGVVGAKMPSDDIIDYLAGLADGDGRVALNMLEMVLGISDDTPTLSQVKESLRRTHMQYDQHGDAHYDAISAFHKSVRGSDADATLFYLARMLEAGEDPLYVARRMVRIASEDVGLADDACLPLATATVAAVQHLGMPEADVVLAHCAARLARAPKSVAVYRAYRAAQRRLRDDPGAAAAPVPLHLRNAPTRLAAQLGHGAEYKYNPDYAGGRVRQEYLPEALRGVKFIDVDQPLGTRVDPDLNV